MQFRNKTAYVWGLRYRWDPSLLMNPVRRFAHFMPPWCVYKATQKSSLSNKKSKHEGIKSSEYKATIKSHLRVHTLSRRERIRFDCDNVSTKKSINSAQTMGTWFDCDQSEYKDSLRLHKQSNMNGSNITVTSVSTKQQLKVIWECTHHRSMRWSNLIVNNVSTKQQKR